MAGVRLTEDQARALIGSVDLHGMDPRLILEVMRQESGFNTGIVSPAGAAGLMQFMPGTAKGMGIDPLDPKQAVEGGARYLSQLTKRYNGNIEHALMAYNWGPGNVDAYLKTGYGLKGRARPKESLDYTDRILGRYNGTMGTPVPTPAPTPEINPDDLASLKKKYDAVMGNTPVKTPFIEYRELPDTPFSSNRRTTFPNMHLPLNWGVSSNPMSQLIYNNAPQINQMLNWGTGLLFKR